MNAVTPNLTLLFSWDFIKQQQEAGKVSGRLHQDLHDNGIRNTPKVTQQHHRLIFSALCNTAVQEESGVTQDNGNSSTHGGNSKMLPSGLAFFPTVPSESWKQISSGCSFQP